MGEGVTFTAELWRWTARKDSADAGAWCFVTLPVDLADDLRERAGEPRGFGSVRVRARVGDTTWDTSVFPDAASGSFVLPVKKSVRTAAGVAEGDLLTVTVSPRDGA